MRTQINVGLGAVIASLALAAQSIAADPSQPPAADPSPTVTLVAPPTAQYRDVRATLDQILMSSRWIGVDVVPAGAALRAQLGISADQGLVVTQVHPESPAENGLAQHDVLTNAGGAPLADMQDLQKQIEAAGDGPLTLKFVRCGRAMSIELKPTARQWKYVLTSPANVPGYWIGVEVAPADETLRDQLRLGERGLVVAAVSPDNPAAKAGLLVHDVLVAIDDRPLTQPDELNARIQEVKEQAVRIKLLRAGSEVQVAVNPVARPESSVQAYFSLTGADAATNWIEFVQPGAILHDADGSSVPTSAVQFGFDATVELAFENATLEGLEANLQKAAAGCKQLMAEMESLERQLQTLKAQQKKVEGQAKP